jgi:hypothetical protein
MIDDHPTPGEHRAGVTHGLTPSAAARLLADLAARLADLGDGAMPDDMGFSLDIGLQPRRISYEREATEAEECAVVAALADAVSPGAEPGRKLFGNGRVHYSAYVVSPAGLAAAAFCSVQPRPGERKLHERRQAERAEGQS